MGHHTKKHRKRTTRRGKYQKISPKKTRRRRQTKRRGGAGKFCGSKPCGSKPPKGNRPTMTSRGSASSSRKKKSSMKEIYNDAKGPHRAPTDNWETLPSKKKLIFIEKQLKCDPRDDLEILEAAEEELKADTAPAGRIDM